MNVASYLFQSPSPSPVQVGRLDPSSKQESSVKTETPPKDETVTKAQNFQASQTTEVTPKVESSSAQLLDVYA
jgi:hypothetical protein